MSKELTKEQAEELAKEGEDLRRELRLKILKMWDIPPDMRKTKVK